MPIADVHPVGLWAARAGNADSDWEDRAAVFGSGPGRRRCIVLDGAGRGFETQTWVDFLVDAFATHGPATLDKPDLLGWAQEVQHHWRTAAPPLPPGPNHARYAHRRATHGAAATLLACEIVGLDTPTPRWVAASLGDVVLFHVRDRTLLTRFPPLTPEEFDNAPATLSSVPKATDALSEHIAVHEADLMVGDHLYIATDKLAQWMLGMHEVASERLWTVLEDIDHDGTFAALVANRRADYDLVNDDVTLVRLRIAPGSPSDLVLRVTDVA